MTRRSEPPGSDLLQAVVDEHGPALWALALSCTRGDRHAAEDLVQETLVRAWRHPQALDGSGGSPRAWLSTVLRRLAIDQERRRQRRPHTVALVAEAAGPAGPAGPLPRDLPGPPRGPVPGPLVDAAGNQPARWPTGGSPFARAGQAEAGAGQAEAGAGTGRGLVSVGATDDGVDRMLDGLVVRAALDQLSPAHRDVLELVVGADLSVAAAARLLAVPPGTVKSRLFYGLRALRLALEELGHVW